MVQGRKRERKWIWWVVFLGLVIVATVIAVVVKQNYFGDNGEEKVAQNDTTGKVVQEVKQKDEDTSDNKVEDGEKSKVQQYEGEDPNRKDALTGAITYVVVNDGRLMVRVNIDQFLDEGKCKMELKKEDSLVYDMEARLIGSVTTSTCEGFDVPVTQLPNGKVSIVVKLSAGEKSGEIMGEVEL